MDQNAKSQAVERIKEAQNVLITVSANPSVDQLAAAIGFTLLLNKLEKHATAVFSGTIPSTIEFLKPEETLEDSTDSLRDFIISLDKSKADKLRYKVEDEVVRIFITPYRTKLSQDDLIFSQGDYNVDVVVALGVDNREHIDQAIIAHGRILHDATVIGVMAGSDAVDVGSINWQDPNASSLCEMLMSISESLKSGSVDAQIATAFLTGIVATTDRFKNEKTTPKVMTMSAQLMAAGANQQLIANELTPPEPEPVQVDDTYVQNETEQSDESDEHEGEGVISLHHYGEEVPHHDAESAEHEESKVEDHHVHIDDTGEFSNADQLREAVEQVQEHKYKLNSSDRKKLQPLDDSEKPVERAPLNFDEVVRQEEQHEIQEQQDVQEQGQQKDVNEQAGSETAEDTDEEDVPLPGEEIRPGDEPHSELEEPELTLPAPESSEDLPKITHERWGKQATYLDHPPSDAPAQDEFSVPPEEELPSIEQAGDQNYSKYISGRPIMDTPLNAADDVEPEPSIDPLASIPQAGPVPVADTVSTQSPLLSTQHDAESPRATEVPTTESPRLSDDGETDMSTKPLGPEVDDSNTLSEIESNVEKYEQEIGESPTGSTSAEEEARKAVMDAIIQGGPSPYEAPNQNIGAQFVPLDTVPQQVTNEAPSQDTPSVDENAPPSVPPPLMPPFPIPGVEVIDPTFDPNNPNQ